ncbi:MAG: 23S rRNA (uracil(1939)-C(5))-methyltransferase RlmD [Proteobacteria bacterium]|nr:23S rRNA (uracil(1939)-C(5))-methyltransferase RlmD [Pseudomonadota bacterium]
MARRRREPETARINAVTHDGRGIAAVSGKKVFVSGALVGEEVRFLRRKLRRNFDEAELLEVLETSADRIEARCDAFGRCGGCALQHVSEQQQQSIKCQTLKDNLERIGKVTPDTWLPPITGPGWNYRRRARLGVKDVPGKGRVLVGFRERHAPFITDMHRCEVLAKPVDGMIDALSTLIGSLSIRTRLPQIEVAVAENAVALVFRVLDPPTDDDAALLQQFGKANSVRIYLQPGGLDSVELLYPDAPVEALYYTLSEFDIRIEFSPVGFVQINSDINQQMVRHAIDLLAPEPGDRLLDLYCGIGNFSLPLARRCREILGVEGDAMLVAAAAGNAALNDLQNATFRTADLGKIDGSEAWLRGGWDKLLLDPARNGAAEVMRLMPVIGAQRIVYVSCHPGTLARDAGLLVNEQGYRLEAAGIIDMFPHTAHAESIAVFKKQ